MKRYLYLLFCLFFIDVMLYGQENLPYNQMGLNKYSGLSDSEKVDYVKKCFREGINMQLPFIGLFADAGGIGIIPWLLEELPEYEFYQDVIDNRLNFIINVLANFRDKHMLTMRERYYIAGIIEGKTANYVKRYRKYDVLVRGMNSHILMFIDENYFGQLYKDIDDILLAKYRAMGLLD